MIFGHDKGKNLKQLCDGVKDAVCIAMGGTGGKSLEEARKNLGIKDLSDRIDNLILSTGTSPAEVQDARLGNDGTAYKTLKARLDAENIELRSDLDKIAYISSNIFDVSKGLAGMYANGVLSDSTIAKNIILPVTVGNVIRFKKDTVFNVYNLGAYLYDTETVLTRIENNAYADFTDNTDYYTVTVKHADMKYIAINYFIDNADTFMVTKNTEYPSSYVPFGGELNTNLIKDGSIKREKTDFKSTLDNADILHKSMISTFTPTMISGKYINFNGNEASVFYGSVSDYINVNEVTDVYTALSNDLYIYFYDDSKNPISGINSYEEYKLAEPKWYELDIPEGAVYVRISNCHNKFSDTEVKCIKNIAKSIGAIQKNIENISEIPNTNIISMYDKIICFGDSLTYSQVYYGSENQQRQAFSTYPQILAKLCGITSTQYAVPGDTPKSWWERYNDTAFNENGLYIVFLGTNGGLTDTIDTDCIGTDISNYADTATGYYGRIMQSIADTGNKAVLIEVFGGGGDSKETTNSVIHKFGDRFGFPVISVDRIDRTNENYHLYPQGGGKNVLHFNDLGYAWLANVVCQEINKLPVSDKYKIMRRQ